MAHTGSGHIAADTRGVRSSAGRPAYGYHEIAANRRDVSGDFARSLSAASVPATIAPNRYRPPRAGIGRKIVLTQPPACHSRIPWRGHPRPDQWWTLLSR